MVGGGADQDTLNFPGDYRIKNFYLINSVGEELQ